MANTPKKIKDPTEAALSAIQDALSVRDAMPESEPEPAAPPAPHRGEPVADPPWRTVRTGAPPREDLFEDEIHPPEEPLQRPANDDRESVGQILRTLQRRPAHTSYVIATVFAVVWMFAGLVLGWFY